MSEQELEFDGLVLRRLTLKDAEKVYQMTSDPDVSRFMDCGF